MGRMPPMTGGEVGTEHESPVKPASQLHWPLTQSPLPLQAWGHESQVTPAASSRTEQAS